MYLIKDYNQKANHIRRNNTNHSLRRMGSFKAGNVLQTSLRRVHETNTKDENKITRETGYY